MRKVYKVFILNEKELVEEVSLFGSLDSKISYGNWVLESVEQMFISKDDAEIWVRRNGHENYQYTILEIFIKE